MGLEPRHGFFYALSVSTVGLQYAPILAICTRNFRGYRKRSMKLSIKHTGCADKSLPRPGGKQATETKLGIYSTYSPGSSIQFSARCSNFCKPGQKKKFRRLSVQPGLRGSNDRVGRKTATFQLFFQSKEQVVVRRGQIRRIGSVIKILEAQVG